MDILEEDMPTNYELDVLLALLKRNGVHLSSLHWKPKPHDRFSISDALFQVLRKIYQIAERKEEMLEAASSNKLWSYTVTFYETSDLAPTVYTRALGLGPLDQASKTADNNDEE